MWRATILTLFPEMFPGPLGLSLAGKALASGLWSLDAHDIRSQATDKHGTVDDTPAGGGVRMAAETWDIERVLAKLLADPRLAEARDRCGVLHALTAWDYVSRDAYASAGGGVCRDLAFDAYPWTDVAVASE